MNSDRPTAPHTPTDTQLQSFHDDELPDHERAALAARLREDPKLRAHLEELARTDRLILQSLSNAPTNHTRPNTPTSARTNSRSHATRLRSPLRIAACAAIAASACIIIWLTTTPSRHIPAAPDTTPAHIPPLAQEPTAGETVSPRRLEPATPIESRRLASWSTPPPPTSPPATAEDSEPRTADAHPQPPALPGLTTLTTGTPDALPPLSNKELMDLGRTLRSAMHAESLLDLLPPEEQIHACRVWAAEPHLRPVVMARLRHLSERGELETAIRNTVSDLSQDPDLWTWLRSYGLAPPPPPKS